MTARNTKGWMCMTIIICDDERVWRERVERDISRWADEHGKSISIVLLASGTEIVDYFKGEKAADLLFLDIDFKEQIDGLGVARWIRNTGNNIPIIFVSNHALKASEGYEVEAMGFLVKDYDYIKLSECMERVEKYRRAQTPKMITVESEQRLIRISCFDIIYIESFGHEVTLHMVSDTINARVGLGKIREKLGQEDFIQIHKSYIASLRFLARVKQTYPYEAELQSGDKIIKLPIGRTYISGVQRVYANSITRGIVYVDNY